MRLAKYGLLAGALVFAIVGLGFLVIPVRWGALVEILLPTPMARTDFRATYGGFNLGVAVFLAICASREDWIRPGLAALGITIAGYGSGRLIGIIAEGTASPMMIAFAVLEWTVAGATLFVWRKLPARLSAL